MFKPLVKDIAIYSLADFIFKFISFATFPIFTFALTVSEFGIYSLLVTMSSMFGLFMMCGINSAMQRLISEKDTTVIDKQIIVSTGLISIFINTCICSCLLIAMLYFSNSFFLAYSQITNRMIIWSLLGGVGMQINTFCMDVVRMEFQPWKYTFFNFMQNALLIGLSLYSVVYLKLGVLGYIAATSLAYLLLIPVCLRMICHQLCWSFNKKLAMKMLSFGYPFIFAGFGYWIFNSMDRWMLSELSNYSEVGLYSIAFRIASVLIFINFAFGQAWNPIALKAFHHNPNYRDFYSRSLSLWFFTLIMISLFTSLFGYEFLTKLTPKEYWDAASLLPYLCMGLALFGTTPILAMGIALEKKTYHYSFAVGLAAISNLLLNYFLIPLYGSQGASIATLSSNLVLWGYYFYSSKKLHPIPSEDSKLIFCLILMGISIVFNLWVNSFDWSYSVVVYKVIFLTAALGSGWMFKLGFFSQFKQLKEA